MFSRSRRAVALVRDRCGSMASEYAVLAALVAVFVIVGLLAFSDAATGLFGFVGDEAGEAMRGN